MIRTRGLQKTRIQLLYGQVDIKRLVYRLLSTTKYNSRTTIGSIGRYYYREYKYYCREQYYPYRYVERYSAYITLPLGTSTQEQRLGTSIQSLRLGQGIQEYRLGRGTQIGGQVVQAYNYVQDRQLEGQQQRGYYNLYYYYARYGRYRRYESLSEVSRIPSSYNIYVLTFGIRYQDIILIRQISNILAIVYSIYLEGQ